MLLIGLFALVLGCGCNITTRVPLTLDTKVKIPPQSKVEFQTWVSDGAVYGVKFDPSKMLSDASKTNEASTKSVWTGPWYLVCGAQLVTNNVSTNSVP
jgi:hypothetical protein